MVGDGFATFTPGVSERRSGTTRSQHSGIKNADAQSLTNQTVTASRAYDAFGNVAASSGTMNGPFGYGGPFGYQSDADSGLKLLGHRYYDSSTGRFLTRDPAEDGRNWYGYCDANPIGYADPDGLRRNVVHYLYVLWDKVNERVLKWGVTKNPKTRYTKRYLEDRNAILKEVGYSKKRREMLDQERMIVETDDGPLNKEPWSSSVKNPGWGGPLKCIVGLFFRDGGAAGEGLAETVDPTVTEIQRRRSKSLEWWLDTE
ncbi:MAG: hypothetical protein AMXMBFR81_28520 [Chthonomonas sp.]